LTAQGEAKRALGQARPLLIFLYFPREPCRGDRKKPEQPPSAPKEIVRRYIANQREHHRRFSFEEEYRRLLERNGVPYDERYLWS
jgi:hypothetical protein